MPRGDLRGNQKKIEEVKVICTQSLFYPFMLYYVILVLKF